MSCRGLCTGRVFHPAQRPVELAPAWYIHKGRDDEILTDWRHGTRSKILDDWNDSRPCTIKKVCFYIAQYPVRWTAQSALHLSSPDRPVHSDTNSASLGSILAMQQLRNDYSLTCPPLSIARYPFKYSWVDWGVVQRMKMPTFRNSSKGFRTRALSIASPAFYHWATMRWSRKVKKLRIHVIMYELAHGSLGQHWQLHIGWSSSCGVSWLYRLVVPIFSPSYE